MVKGHSTRTTDDALKRKLNVLLLFFFFFPTSFLSPSNFRNTKTVNTEATRSMLSSCILIPHRVLLFFRQDASASDSFQIKFRNGCHQNLKRLCFSFLFYRYSTLPTVCSGDPIDPDTALATLCDPSALSYTVGRTGSKYGCSRASRACIRLV